MLINVRHDRKFQRYLDGTEQALFVEMSAILRAGIRLHVARNSIISRDYIRERGGQTLLRFYRKIYVDQFRAVTDAMRQAKAARPRDTQSDFLRSQVDWLRSDATSTIDEISDNLASDIHDLVADMVAQGRSTDRITDEITQLAPELSQTRAATIARTETHTSALAAIDETIQYKNISIQTKTWWTAGDGRVRPSHAAMHGTTIANDEPFSLNGGDMMYPGDDSLGAGAEEIVNCRCSVLYQTEDATADGGDGGDGGDTGNGGDGWGDAGGNGG